MQVPFVKYHGAGNDFILLNQASAPSFDLSDHRMIQSLCSRHFGIGADGLMVVKPSMETETNFVLDYFNADGHLGSLCGNGSRCAVAFAHSLGLFPLQGTFLAFDGLHQAWLHGVDDVEVLLSDPIINPKVNDDYWLDTGSPHLVRFQPSLDEKEAFKEGQRLRYDDYFAPGGLNVNFVKPSDEGLEIITYERGVEDLTLSCGTGAVAAAIAMALETKKQGLVRVPVIARGGTLFVSFVIIDNQVHNVRLRGPAIRVFSGTIEV